MPLLAKALETGPAWMESGSRRSREGQFVTQVFCLCGVVGRDALPAHTVQTRLLSQRRHGSSVVVASRGCHEVQLLFAGVSSCCLRRRSVRRFWMRWPGRSKSTERVSSTSRRELSLDRTWFVELLEGIRERLTAKGGVEGMTAFSPKLDDASSHDEDCGFRI